VEKWRKKWMRKEKERVKTLVIRDTVIRDTKVRFIYVVHNGCRFYSSKLSSSISSTYV
jgi:ribosomal protein S19